MACCAELDDPRTGNAALHGFHELLMIACCSVFVRRPMRGRYDVIRLGEGPASLPLPGVAGRVARHDTISRLFRLLDVVKSESHAQSAAPPPEMSRGRIL